MLNEAQEAHRAGQFEEALAAYEKATVIDPEAGHAWFGLGTIALQVGQYEPAVDMLNKAIECDGAVAAYFINLGEAYRRLSQFEAAVAVLHVACDLEPDNPEAWLNLGVAQGEMGDFTRAFEALSKAAESDPSRAEIYRNLGVVKQKQNELPEAIANYRMAISLQPRNAAALCGLAESLRLNGQHREAAATYEKVIEFDPDNVTARTGLAFALCAAGDLLGAKDKIESILLADPDNHDALLAQSELLIAIGDQAGAIASLSRAIAVAPLSEAAYLMLGAQYLQVKDFRKAAEIFLRALSIRPRDVSIMRRLADAYKGMEEKGAAQVMLRQALAIDPNDTETLHALGVALTSGDRKPTLEAIKHLRRATELAPDRAEYWSALGWALYRIDELEEALAAFDQGLTVSPDSSTIMHNRGAVLFDYGRFDEAIAHFKKVLDRNPNDLSALSNSALSYIGMGELKIAKNILEKAQRIATETQTDYPALTFNCGTFQLLRGNLIEGWSMYDQRDAAKRFDHMPCPPWQGEPLQGKRIFIWQDQGVGDQIMFGRMIQEVIDQGARAVVDCDPRLLALLRRTFPKATFVARRNPPHPLMTGEFDYRVPAGGLAHWLRPTIASFPRTRKGFLKTDAARQAYWRERLKSQFPTGLKVGICWRSRIRTTRRSLQYAGIESMQSLLAVPGVNFINLQYDQCADELAYARTEFGAAITNFLEVDMHNDFDETCALIANLDLVITAPTAVAMLSGGLGVKTWNFMANNPWTMLGTKRLPFMPAIERVYRRRWDADWQSVMARIAEDLGSLASSA